MIDIAIFDYHSSEVIMVKADEKIIDNDFNGDVAAYIESPTHEGGLGFDLENCYYMHDSKIRLICPNGSPIGGMEIGCDSRF